MNIEQCAIIAIQSCHDDQIILRLHAPPLARHAQAGHFTRLADLTLPILRVDPGLGWVEVFCAGLDTTPLSGLVIGDAVSLSGPLGTPFQLDISRPRALLLGANSGMAPLVFLAESLRGQDGFLPLMLLASDRSFPFSPRPSRFIVPGMPPGVIAAIPLIEDWDMPSRMVSEHDVAGCFDGELVDLAQGWLDAQSTDQLNEVMIYACVPPTLRTAVNALATDYGLPCQSLAEAF